MKVFFYEVIKTCKRTIFQILLIISGFISLSITTTGFSMPIRYEGHGGPVMGLDTSIQKNLMASIVLITLFYYGNLMKLRRSNN